MGSVSTRAARTALDAPSRLGALARTGLAHAGSDAALDATARACARALRAPVSLVTLVDDAAQRFPGACGIGALPEPVAAARGTPLSHSLCARAVADDGPLVVGDLHADPELADHPACTALGVVAYAGVPLRFDGETIGAVCAIDVVARRWSRRDLETLQAFAELAGVQIERDAARAGLQRAFAALEASDRRRNEFLATLAHELRHPLTPIRNAARVLDRLHDGSTTARRAIAAVERQVGVMRRLVEDLLDLNRLERDVLRLERRRVSLDELLDAAVESVQPDLEGRGLDFELHRASQPTWLEVDPVRLPQVLVNLLSNAAKFTPRGGRVTLEAWPEGDAAVFRVRDTGIGIAPQSHERIFELFAQHRSESGPAAGLGIGLALSRRLVAMHGGTLVVDSEGPGRGSTFTLRVPARQRDAG